MNPNEIGKRLGIGLRVAGRIAQQRAQESGVVQPSAGQPVPGQNPGLRIGTQTAHSAGHGYGTASRDLGKKTHKITRAAGRGIGGFLRPFGRVGGLLWLEVTGFFFGMFAIFFARGIWSTRLSYLAGPQHPRFLVAVGLTAVFAYLSVSAFWRARRR